MGLQSRVVAIASNENYFLSRVNFLKQTVQNNTYIHAHVRIIASGNLLFH